MAKNDQSFREVVIEVLIPLALYLWIAPDYMNGAWLSIQADPATTWVTYAEMYALTIGIGICWLMFYNSVRLGLFPRKRTR